MLLFKFTNKKVINMRLLKRTAFLLIGLFRGLQEPRHSWPAKMALCQNGTLPKRQPRHSKLACFLVLADYIDYARARGRDSPPAKMAVCQNGSCCILIHPEIESQPVAFRYTLRLNLNLLHFTTASRMCPCVCDHIGKSLW